MCATGKLCVHQIILAMWRRKPILLFGVTLAVILLVLLQYSSLGNSNLHSDSLLASPMGMAVPVPAEQQWPGQQQRPAVEPKPANTAGGRSKTYIPELRFVHFDLKGAPPKVTYLKQLFPLIREAGANGILLEYEDMFPYHDSLEPIRAKNAYSKEDIGEILAAAKGNSLEVIPLVQTFGHLEFVLKLPEFRHVREVDEHPTALCPSRNDSFTVVSTIVDQVLELHPNVKWLHIGCDEVFHMGYCSRCMQRDREDLFVGHVQRVARHVRDRHKRVPIIWDDMLRQIGAEKLKMLGKLVEPMVWTYVKDVYRFISYNNWATYSEVFDSVWAASSFKGAFGETLTVPNTRMHLENNEGWLEVMAEQHAKFHHFRGIVVTGWQRYDHFATLCELLPAGLPSLILNLLVLTNGAYSSELQGKFHSLLKCSQSRTVMDLQSDPFLWQKSYGCFFPGAAVFRLTQTHSETVKKAEDYMHDVTIGKAWVTDYNVRHNLTLPSRVDQVLEEHSSTLYSLTSLIHQARDVLRDVFDEYTVAEWIEQNIYPSVLRLERLWNESLSIKKPRTWPVRPLEPLADLRRFNIGGV